ncbi:glycosyltransferase family 4 protein [Pseudorhodoferax sp.]|uniref:glycosyltransferase family 4 protein n=1 Tax=Pseudorhodoferax sp. TaxID=1993553 RepID=UPI002DD6A327|nr:glycosyltransferase [Pseudorhodoferax sp.]
MTSPVRIAFVITGLGVGGAEAMLLKLLQRIDRQAFSPHVLSLSSTGELGPAIEALGIPVTALDMPANWRAVAALPRLMRLLRTLRPDVVHTWMYHADLLGGLAARGAGHCRLVWGIRHSNLAPDLNKRSTLAVARLCAGLSRWLPNRILVCSQAALQAHARFGYGTRRMSVIPNGFDVSRFSPDAQARAAVRAELQLGENTPLVGVVARFDPQKNHLGFMRAMAHLHRQSPATHFLLAGRGIDPRNATLLQAARQAGIERNCHLLGQRNDIPRLMAALDVLVSPSLGEAFPNAIGEAMACAVPCVATDVGDCAALLGETGRIVPRADDPIALAQATASLLELPGPARRQLGELARARVMAQFELGQVVAQYEHFYRTLMQEGPAA